MSTIATNELFRSQMSVLVFPSFRANFTRLFSEWNHFCFVAVERFRPVLMELERDKIMAKQDAAALQVTLDQERSRVSFLYTSQRQQTILMTPFYLQITMLSTRAAQAETEVGVLRRKMKELENTCELLKQENADLSMALTQREMSTEKLKQRCQSKVAIESEKANQLERQLRDKNRELMVRYLLYYPSSLLAKQRIHCINSLYPKPIVLSAAKVLLSLSCFKPL